MAIETRTTYQEAGDAGAIPQQWRPIEPLDSWYASQPVVHGLPAYEPPLSAELPAAPDDSTNVVLSGLPRAAAFQLTLDLQWAQEHRPVHPEGWLSPREAGVTRFILAATVDVLAGRRAPEQLRPYFMQSSGRTRRS
jgi:hypothetical protein